MTVYPLLSGGQYGCEMSPHEATVGGVCQWTACGAWVLNGASQLNEVITVMWHVSYVSFIVFPPPVAGYPVPFLPNPPPPPPLDAPWQKASTHPLIHGALLGRWFNLVFPPCWVTPLIWTNMVPSPPSTPKTDWWALPSHFFYEDTKAECLCFLFIYLWSTWQLCFKKCLMK